MKVVSWVAREIGLSLCSKEEFRKRWLKGAAPLAKDDMEVVPPIKM